MDSFKIAAENIPGDHIGEDVIVANGIDKYIERPCREAVEKLWSLNIATFKSSGNRIAGSITFDPELLSDDNRMLFDSLAEATEGLGKSRSSGYAKNQANGKASASIFVANCRSEEEVSRKLLQLASIFQMQDIKEGVFTIEEFLTSCGCSRYEVAPDGSINHIFDPTKVTRSVDKYVADAKALRDPIENLIYKNEYYYGKHTRYLEYQDRKVKKE